jgi:chromosome segregation ATPase
MQTNAAATGFPSPEFERRITELRAAIANDRSEIETAQKKLAAMCNNRDALTAIGKNPDEEIRNARAGTQALEQRIAVVRSQIVQLFQEEHKALEQYRDETWGSVYEGFVKPMSAEILAAAQILNAKMREVVALAKSQPSDFSTLLDSFKTSADKLNERVSAFGDLGIGGNLAMPQADLRSNAVDAIKRIVKDAFGPTSAIAEVLALFVVQPWKPKQPTLAERLDDRRKEFQRHGEIYNP